LAPAERWERKDGSSYPTAYDLTNGMETDRGELYSYSVVRSDGVLQRQRFDYIVTGEFDLRYASDPNAWAAHRDRWQKRLAILPVQADFGQIATPVVPYLWRTNDERILILGGSMPR
jgi:hypothetical protein